MRQKIIKIALYILLLIPVWVSLNDISRAARLSGEEEVTPVASESAGNNSGSGAGPVSEHEADADDNKANDSGMEPRYVSIDFDDVDIAEFIKLISDLTGKNFVVDSSVKGNVTIISPQQITVDEAYEVFESVLEVHGFTTVPAGNITKIVPALDARSKNIETRLKKESISPEDKVVTQLVSLKYADPDEVKKLLSAFISKTSVMESYTPTGMLIITDVLSNIKRLLDIIEAIDVPGTGSEISVVPLEYATAQGMATSLNTVFQAKTRAAQAARETTTITIVPDERTNSLIILASAVDTVKVKQLIGLLDKETPKGEGKLHLYYLQNARAEDLAKVLTEIPTGDTSSAATREPAGETAVVLSRDVQIIADKATNSLIINASKNDYLILEDIIQKLDIPRKMVYIEALIMEVSLSKEFDLGTQWYVGDNASVEGRDVVAFGSSSVGTDNMPSIGEDGTLKFSSGLSLGVLGDVIKIGDLEFSSIQAVIRALRTDSDVQIHSTPQIMTLDNEEAEIIVAQNKPFLTSKDESVSGTDYSNYEWKEVGVTLRITPQINQEKLVRLNIYQEVSSVVEVAEQAIGLSTTQSRKAETTVVIKDGQTIVIGGLIDETESKSRYKVPILGDIPLLGTLFSSKSESNSKTNLYIFITPHIIGNFDEAEDVYENKKAHIDSIKEGSVRMYEGRSESKDMRLCNLGYGYLEAKDYARALEYYEKAMEINPENPYALLNTGFIYEKLGEKEKAADMYEKLIKLDPDVRAAQTTDNMQLGRKLSDIARDNLENLGTKNETNR